MKWKISNFYGMEMKYNIHFNVPHFFPPNNGTDKKGRTGEEFI